MSGPVVRVAGGEVRGAEGDGVVRFWSIPFAAPPVGERRFAPPEPREPWSGVLDATRRGPSAPQNPSLLETSLGADSFAMDEDCLALSVFTPGLDDGARPVLVWIHGGGFETGSPTTPWYDGANLARRGVVVVTVGYRLGALGFCHLEEVRGSGNAGLLDQVAGLRWVRDHVAAFGGDPDQVTVFGESAGAMSIGGLLGLPAADGLFRRAILQSGAVQNVHHETVAARVTEQVAAAAGVSRTVEALRALPIDELLAAQSRVARRRPFEDGLAFQPVVDGDVIPVQPLLAVRDGASAEVDLVIGTTLEEMRLFPLLVPSLSQIDEAGLAARSDGYFGRFGREPGSTEAAYVRLAGASAPERWLVILTDLVFRIPAIRLAEAHHVAGGRTWMYLFAERSSAFGGLLGSCHALEIPFVWDNLDAAGAALLVGDITPERRQLARALADAWVAFASGADPAADGLPTWPAYDPVRRATLRIDAAAADIVDDPDGTERRHWDGIDPGIDSETPATPL